MALSLCGFFTTTKTEREALESWTSRQQGSESSREIRGNTSILGAA
jgi:hypothetical protein